MGRLGMTGCGARRPRCPRISSARAAGSARDGLQLSSPAPTPDLRGWWGEGEKEGEEKGGVEDLWEGAGMAPTLLGRSDRGTEEGAAGPFPPPPPQLWDLKHEGARGRGRGSCSYQATCVSPWFPTRQKVGF